MANAMYRFILKSIGGNNTKLATSLNKSNRDWYKSRHVDWMEEKQAFVDKIKFCTENGKIAIVTSGMDCDGIRYSGQVHLVDAIPVIVNHNIEEANKWADGPIYHYIMKPSEAKEIEYSSRDLGMEAFEDGHPSVIYY